MISLGNVVKELARTFGVLALLFLSFAHQPSLARDTSASFRYADGSVAVFCGQAPSGGRSTKSGSCDACRIAAGIDMPVMPPSLGELFTVALWIGRADFGVAPQTSIILSAGRPRAPPVFV